MQREPEVGDVISFRGNKAIFVVEKAEIRQRDRYPSGLYVQARALKILRGKDGKIWNYNPKAELRGFFTSGRFHSVIWPKDIKIHGRMKMVFVQ